LTPVAARRIVVVDDNTMDGYVTVEQAARQLDRSLEQVRRYLREGRLRGRRIGQQWFIEEGAIADWRPGRRRTDGGRIGEAVATYEARAMKTDGKKKGETLSLKEWLREVDEIAEEISREYGEFDVVEMLRRDREEH
jgi:excisionase family DNA binding protein